MATITKNNKTKLVKNLGWLLRHHRDIIYLSFRKIKSPLHEGELIAVMRDGTLYRNNWASFQVFNQWRTRPSLRHLPLYIEGKTNSPT